MEVVGFAAKVYEGISATKILAARAVFLKVRIIKDCISTEKLYQENLKK